MVHPRVLEELMKIDEMIGERPHHLLSRSSNNGGRIQISSMYLTGMPSQDGRKDQYNRNAKVVRSSCAKVLIDTGSFVTLMAMKFPMRR